jgi:dipeptidyl aminopeptidase/acylaminoacyl peptidase/predicted GH43/DUF377 family glycosyl hydrolase
MHRKALLLSVVSAMVLACAALTQAQDAGSWQIGPFTRPATGDPVISARPESTFIDPVLKAPVSWEALHTFNPAAVVRNGKVIVLYRAEDNSGAMEIGNHTSRLGMAESTDGIHFTRRPAPVFFPAEDDQKAREWPGGTEDPRIVESEDGTYVLTYTQWNRKVAQMAIATSRDLEHWTKYGPAFLGASKGNYDFIYYKSAGIVTRLDPVKKRLIAAKIDGKYWMYWGEGAIHLATSSDMHHWSPVEDAPGDAVTVMGPRPGRFDSSFPEAGPPPVLTDAGIVFIYNGKNATTTTKDPELDASAYAAGEALFDAHNPARLIAQTDHPVLRPAMPYEKTGQYAAGTTFSEGLVNFKGQWFLYYGCADSLVSVAIAPGTSGIASSAKPASARRPMTFEDMMAMKRLGETAVSPDGKWLIYSATTVNLDQNTKTAELWIQAIAGGEPQKLAVAQPGDGGPQFAPDGRSVLFLSGRVGGQQVWLADFDAATGATSNARKLTAISTEADNALWSPDGHSVVFTSSVYPDCPAIVTGDKAGDKCNADRDAAQAGSKVKAQVFTHLLYRHWNQFTGAKRSHLFVASIADGGSRDLTPNDPHDIPPFSLGGGGGFAIAPDSKELAFTENLDEEPAISTNADIFTLDLTSPAAKPVKVSTSKGGDFSPAYSPDGKYLAWRSQERAGYEADKFRLFLYDRAAKTLKDLLPKLDNWVDEFAWTPDSKEIYFVSGQYGYAPLKEVEVASGRTYSWQTIGQDPTGMVQTHGEYGDLHILPDGETVLASRMAAAQPGEVVRISQAQAITDLGPMAKPYSELLKASGMPLTKQYVQVTHLNDALLVQLDLPKMESFWFDAEDKTRLQGFLFRPPAFDPAKKYPLKYLIHGGPQGAFGDAWSYRWNAELFAANGYVVAMVNFRGSTGYGQTVVDGVNGDWGGKPFSDLMLGLDSAEQQYLFIDKTRECALGASYGGYMANWVLGHTDRFKCIVSHDGMFNAESAFGTTEEDWFNVWEFKGHPWDYYGKPDAENPFRKWSPSLYAKNFKTPTLVIHGQLDYRLDVSEGFQLFDTLQLLKVPSKMLYFPDEGHWVLKPQNSRLWWKTVNDWVDEWTAQAASSH